MRIFSLLSVLLICGCSHSQEPEFPDEFWEIDPVSPSQMDLDSWCEEEYENLERENNRINGGIDLYRLKGKLWTGWACSNDPTTEHQFRYSYFKEGVLWWQLGYFSNGQLDHDFRMQNGKNCGSNRMWKADGWPYIENYYSGPDEKHGLWKRWYGTRQLAMQALWEKGKLIYKAEWDQEGTLVKSEGKLPEELAPKQLGE